ncbi:MAG TPA: NrfD/PsrC family molybdoenzyme membrane anchor subunit [Methylomirabilota bacterium]|jgi:formate-dependent nitrite reductase membrane component NrfD|nr:NrfD/PsrC family molybdoenzyme membrane anchor subunit [Methylomirabilota bacterium]
MPSTFFTEAPHWRWLIILYFFIGGIAGGCYFLAALIDLTGRPADRPLARLGYLIALPAVVVCGIVLIADLGRPERFWHMLLQSATWRPMFKTYSPMSLGAWGLLVFGGFAFLSFLGALADGERRRGFAVLRPPALLGTSVSILGGLAAFFLVSYTGVLLAVTNRPIWSDTTLLGAVFLVSSASTSIALLVLLGSRRVFFISGLRALQRFDVIVLVLELLTLIALVVSLGSLARVWLSAWGALLLFGVVGLGIVLPLVLHRRAPSPLAPAARLAAVLVLVGGFLLRVVIVLSSEAI